jgi:hypothetical protein
MAKRSLVSVAPRVKKPKAAYNKGFGNKLAGSWQLRLLVGYGAAAQAGRTAPGFVK